MRKLLFGALALFVALAALRRFGPTVGKRAMERCQEMMQSGAETRGAEEESTQLAS
jgi:hypothetical protein